MAANERDLRRLPKEGQIAGVCAGLAEYFNVDVTLVRVAFVLLAFMTGGGMILVYIVLAVVMPSSDTVVQGGDVDQNIQELKAEMSNGSKSDRLRNIFGLGLILLGSFMLLRMVFPGWLVFNWGFVWPVVLILLGVFIATRRRV